ncbi:hypothetical protein HHK36_020298 [Tetracentron sinense]|uniref:Uncharacterized protein n=1 Tax=Tetracentron sinense TaxID=13715 RepID=A0A835D887_TETSI|nr:hypothetical protein HHK36_020298 [Tetracentron sinense]
MFGVWTVVSMNESRRRAVPRDGIIRTIPEFQATDVTEFQTTEVLSDFLPFEAFCSFSVVLVSTANLIFALFPVAPPCRFSIIVRIPPFFPAFSIVFISCIKKQRDIQSYLSRAFLYFAPTSHKFLILVDNQSWLMNKHSKSIHIWQLMVIKYRMSPFTNTRTLLRSPSLGSNAGCLKSSSQKSKNLYRWFSVIDAGRWPEKPLFSLMDLCKALHGFIVFEVAWKDVRGINYLNELQTDTAIAMEVKSMIKWEFSGIHQALNCISSWFSGTPSETQSLQSNLNRLCGEVLPSRGHWGYCVSCKEQLFHGTSRVEVLSEDIFFDVRECSTEANNQAGYSLSWKDEGCPKDKFSINHLVEDHADGKVEAEMDEYNVAFTQYKDALLLFRFSDRDLPFKLRHIITSDLRLLTLLESGLPAWVIFLQSYPLFCQFYRPWMRPLVRTLYILISLITVIIGFYDLYKHVPLLKTTASHLCGPLFDWIEAWDMISRIRYLGTMLFLQNFEKAIKWFLTMMRPFRMLLSLLTEPLMDPLAEVIEFISPTWSIFAETGVLFSSTAWVMVESTCNTIIDLVKVLLSPFELLYSYILTIVAFVYQIICSIGELFCVPIQFILVLANYVVSMFSDAYDLLKWAWMSASSMGLLTCFAQAKPTSSEISIWHAIWKDLFSKVFRSLRSIIRGLVTFFTSCNRHRLSIYNHMRAILQQPYRLLRLGPRGYLCRQTPQMESHITVESKECDRCK